MTLPYVRGVSEAVRRILAPSGHESLLQAKRDTEAIAGEAEGLHP